VTIVADRESDIYEEWSRIPDERTHLLTRAKQDRKLADGSKLFSQINRAAITGTYEVNVKARKGKRHAHIAQLDIRYGEVSIPKPINCKDESAKAKISLRYVDVKEQASSVVAGDEPIHWCLLTTHEIKSNEDALQLVHWYMKRWNIEELFRVLKRKGLKIEESQLEAVENLMKLAVIAMYAAMNVMQLTLARKGSNQSAEVVFTKEECEFLSHVLPTIEGRTEKQKNGFPKGKLSWAAWIIARLGGWKGYVSESPPGPITMYNGLDRFRKIHAGWELAKMCA